MHVQLVELKFRSSFLNKAGVFRAHLYAIYSQSTTRGKFVADTSGTSKKVKHLNVFEIELITKNIKKAFFRKVGSWPSRKVFGRNYLLSTVFATNYSHNATLNKFAYRVR